MGYPIHCLVSFNGKPDLLHSDRLFNHGDTKGMDVYDGRFALYRNTEVTEDHGVHGGRFAPCRTAEFAEDVFMNLCCLYFFVVKGINLRALCGPLRPLRSV